MEHNSQYQTEKARAMSMDGESKNAAADEIIHKYKQILYGAAEFKESMRNRGKIFSDALTTYQLSYFHAKISGVGRCSFTWKVAGRALVSCKPYKSESLILCLASVLHEGLG